MNDRLTKKQLESLFLIWNEAGLSEFGKDRLITILFKHLKIDIKK